MFNGFELSSGLVLTSPFSAPNPYLQFFTNNISLAPVNGPVGRFPSRPVRGRPTGPVRILP